MSDQVAEARVASLSGAKPRSAPPVESVRRALKVLACFNSTDTELGVTEIGERLDLHKSTVHRLLATLQAEGFVYQLQSGKYTLTWKVLQFSAVVRAHRGIHSAALEVLRPLAAETGETAHLAILDGSQVLYVEKVESANQLRMPSAVGRHAPIHATALGKVLIADLDTAALRQLLYGNQLGRLTPATITDPEALIEQLARVREEGVALDEGEIEEGLCCVAAPVRDSEGETCAAISIAGPASRVSEKVGAHGDAVRRASALLSELLGPDARELRTLTPSYGGAASGTGAP